MGREEENSDWAKFSGRSAISPKMIYMFSGCTLTDTLCEEDEYCFPGEFARNYVVESQEWKSVVMNFCQHYRLSIFFLAWYGFLWKYNFLSSERIVSSISSG